MQKVIKNVKLDNIEVNVGLDKCLRVR